MEAALYRIDENSKIIKYLTNLIAGYDIGSSHDIGGPLGGLDENTADETPSWPPERKYTLFYKKVSRVSSTRLS